MPSALITGITGQDGQFLAEFLHGKGYEVFGLIKGQNNPKGLQLQEDLPFLELVSGDLQDLPSLVAALEYTQPDEVYNLGAISFVAMSFKQAELTANVTGLGVLRLLEAIRMVGGSQNNPMRFYQASSSEMFGKVRETPADRADAVPPPLAVRLRQGVRPPDHGELPRELRPVRLLGHPVQPRERAPRPRVRHPQGHQRRRPHQARPPAGARRMGTLDAKRDWGYAGDYVKAMWAMLQQPEPDDYVVATGETHEVREFVQLAFEAAGRRGLGALHPPGRPLLPAGRGRPAGRRRRPRPATVLGWKPEVDFANLVRRMVENDLKIEGAKAG